MNKTSLINYYEAMLLVLLLKQSQQILTSQITKETK